MKTWLLLLSLSLPLGAHAIPLPGIPEVTHREFDFVKGERLVVRNTAGRITVTKTDRPRVVIAATKRRGPETCVMSAEKSLDWSEVRVQVQRQPNMEPCEIDLAIQVPEKTDVDVGSDSGQVSIADIKGRLTFAMGSGNLAANGQFTGVDGKSGSGSVEVLGLKGGGRVEVGSGSINLKFLDAPAGDLEVRAGSGDAVLSIPKDTKLNASLLSGTGGIENDFGNSSSPELNLSARTGTGDLKVKAY